MKKQYPNYRLIENKLSLEQLKDSLSNSDKKVLEDYKRYSSKNAGQDKVVQRTRYVLQFRHIANIEFKMFTPETLQDIRLMIKDDSSREINGRNEVIAQLKFFGLYLWNDLNKIKDLKKIRQPGGYNKSKINSETLLTDLDKEKLLRSAETIREKLILNILFETGIRPIELRNMKFKDINFYDDIVKIKIFSTKTNDSRIVILKHSLNLLKQWKNQYPYPEQNKEDYLFPSTKNRGMIMARQTISEIFRKLGRKANIEKNVYPYLVRHTRMTELNRKLPGKVASSYGGHSEKIAEMYTHLNENDVVEDVLKAMYSEDEKLTDEQKDKYELLRQELQEIKNLFSPEMITLLKSVKDSNSKSLEVVNLA